MGRNNLNVRLKFVSLFAIFAKTQAIHLREKWWNKILNYGTTPQVFNAFRSLQKKKMIGREKRLRRAMFLIGTYCPRPGILLALFRLKRQPRPPCFRPVFQPQRFFLSLRWPCFGWGEGEVGRGPPPSLFSSKHPASPTDSQQWTTILKDASRKKTAANAWYVSVMFPWWAWISDKRMFF